MLSKYASILWKYKSSLLTNILSKYTSILSKYKGILSNHKVYFQVQKYTFKLQVYFQSTKVYSGSTKVDSEVQKYTVEKKPKSKIVESAIIDSIDLLALFGVYAGIISQVLHHYYIHAIVFCFYILSKELIHICHLDSLVLLLRIFHVTALLPNPDLSKYILVLISCFELIYFSCFSPSRFTCGVLS